jgi:Mrp family chromosome partitioning ATPase
MTIQDALERAKQLHRQRKEDLPRQSSGRTVVAPDESASLAAIREELQAESDVSVTFSDLARVEFNGTACAQNHILVTDEQMAEAGRAAPAYRLMRGRILHRLKAAGWSCIGITSPGPGEGKTVTTLNLAISIAREKQRTVYLLDLDMRNSSVFARVGVQPPRALSQYFTEGLAPEEVLFATGIPNLIIAGNRESVPSASELLASPRLDELLKYIRRRSKGALILIDLPPVLSTDEALVVAPRADAMFLVVAEGVTRRDGLAKAIDLLSDFTVGGVILNRSSEQMGGDYYGY